MTLEAALTMPLVMICVLFLIYLIQASIVAMVLQGALSQTARQTAAIWYPISESLATADDALEDRPRSNWKSQLAGAQDTVGKLAPYLPVPLSDWAGQFAAGNWSPDALMAKQALEPRVAERLRLSGLPSSRMKLVTVHLPDRDDASDAFITLEAEYKLPFSLPWSGRQLRLKASARERAWIGGERLAAAEREDGSGAGALAFVSLDPNPVQRGRRVTLVLKAEPGASVDLKVVYKSGLSQARHLGEATADSAGRVSWTWLVSGNTTPGTWAWEASYDGGSLQQTFEVQSKGAGKGG